uniref:Incw4 n=1 Tax=Arundo donax TaxID=35708 RepID=A0A0A9EMA3_ARUDO
MDFSTTMFATVSYFNTHFFSLSSNQISPEIKGTNGKSIDRTVTAVCSPPRFQQIDQNLLIGFTFAYGFGHNQAVVSDIHGRRRELPRLELGYPHHVSAIVEHEQVTIASFNVLRVHSSCDAGPSTSAEALHHRMINQDS